MNKKSSEYKIRSLKRKDRVIVSKMIEKLVDKIGDTQILELITSAGVSEDGESNPEGKTVDVAARTKLGLEIIRLLMSIVNDELTEWFASLLGVTIEEFDELPVDIEVEIVKQLQEADEVVGFFTGAFQLFKGTLASKKILKIKKTK